MQRIDELKQELGEIQEDMHEIIAGGALTAEKRSKFDRLSARADEIKGDILRIDKDDSLSLLMRSRTGRPPMDPIRGQDVTGVKTEETRALAPDESYKKFLEQRGLIRPADNATGSGIGDIFRQLAIGPKNEAEKRDLAEGTSAAGGYLVPTHLQAEVVDLLRAKAYVMKAGARTVPLTTRETTLARLLTDPVAAWKVENESVTPTGSTFDALIFRPKTLICVLKASRELLEDAPNLNSVISSTLGKVFGNELDRVALFGSGSDPEPAGITVNSEIGTVDAGGTLTSYDKLLDALETIEAANGNVPTAAFMAPRTKRDLAGLKDTLNQQLRLPRELEGLPFYSTTQVPTDQDEGSPATADGSSIIIGDFTQLYVGVRQELRIELLKERYAEAYQFAFLCALRADIQLARGDHFAVISGITAS